MAVFEYQAIARTGKTVKGIIDAESAVAARRKLREQDLSPTALKASFGKEVVAEQKIRGGGRVSRRDVALMTRQLGVLLQAGMDLVEALGALLDQTSSPRLRKVIYDIRAKVNEGSRLADALGAHPRYFPDLYTNMVGAGETSGALEQVLFRLADIQERNVKLSNRITSMMFYPILMVLFGSGMVTMLMMVVVPKIIQVFEKRKMELPGITKALVATCNFLQYRWWVIVIVVFGLFALWRMWIARPQGRRQWDKLKLRLPLIGGLYLKIITARFARTMGTMLESGLTMMNALDVVRSVVQNKIIEEALDDVKTGVRRGRDLAAPMRETGIFPSMMIHMVELGQRSGQMEPMLLKVADTYEDDVQMTVDALVSLLEPLIIIVMGMFVAFLVAAILLPVFGMSNLRKGM